MNKSYIGHLRYEKVSKIISKKQCTVEQLVKKTSIPIASLYRILNSLLADKKIVSIKTKGLSTFGVKPRIFKLKRGKQI